MSVTMENTDTYILCGLDVVSHGVVFGVTEAYWTLLVIGLYMELLEHIDYRAVYGVTGAYRL